VPLHLPDSVQYSICLAWLWICGFIKFFLLGSASTYTIEALDCYTAQFTPAREDLMARFFERYQRILLQNAFIAFKEELMAH
jgi:hypothetical protein